MKVHLQNDNQPIITKHNSKKISPLDLYISAKFKKTMSALNLKRADVANMLGVSLAQIKKYEDGKNKISVSNLYALANGIGLDFTYFISGFDIEYKHDSISESMLAEKELDDSDLLVALYKQIEDPLLKAKAIEILKVFAKKDFEETTYSL